MELVELPRREKFFVGRTVVALQAENLAEVDPVDGIGWAHLDGFFADATRGIEILGVDRDTQPVHGKVCRVLRTDLQRLLEMLARRGCFIAIEHLNCAIEERVGFVSAFAARCILNGAGAANILAPVGGQGASRGL